MEDDTERRAPPDVPHVNEIRATDQVPRADHFRVMRCDDRSHAHIVLFDEQERPIADFTVNEINVEHLTRECERVFAAPGLQ